MQKNNTNDKLFDAILKVATEKALEQEMDDIPSCEKLNTQYQPSSDLDKRIRKMISSHNRKNRSIEWKNIIIKILASFTVFIIISSTILLSVEATRNYIFNAVIRWQEDHFSIEHGENKTNGEGICLPVYLPEGFKEVSSNDTGDIIRIVYENADNVRITFKQSSSEIINFNGDNENKIYLDIKINGHTAYLFESNVVDKNNMLIWEINGTMYSLSSEIERNELIQIAESVKK